MPNDGTRIYSEEINGIKYGVDLKKDVCAVLGEPSDDLKTVCTSKRINPDSLIKPIQTRDNVTSPNPFVLPSQFKHYQWGYTYLKGSYDSLNALINAAKKEKWTLRPIEAQDFGCLQHFDGYNHTVRTGDWLKPVIHRDGLTFRVDTRLTYSYNDEVVHPYNMDFKIKGSNINDNWYACYLICKVDSNGNYTAVYASCDSELSPYKPEEDDSPTSGSGSGTSSPAPDPDSESKYIDLSGAGSGSWAPTIPPLHDGSFSGKAGDKYVAIAFMTQGKWKSQSIVGIADMPWSGKNVLIPNINEPGTCISDPVILKADGSGSDGSGKKDFHTTLVISNMSNLGMISFFATIYKYGTPPLGGYAGMSLRFFACASGIGPTTDDNVGNPLPDIELTSQAVFITGTSANPQWQPVSISNLSFNSTYRYLKIIADDATSYHNEPLTFNVYGMSQMADLEHPPIVNWGPTL